MSAEELEVDVFTAVSSTSVCGNQVQVALTCDFRLDKHLQMAAEIL